MKNVMLDLETMGKGPRAAIVTIGAVFFDPMTGELGAEFEAHIDLRDSAKFGEIDPDTVLWWLGNSKQARDAITTNNQERLRLETALLDFYQWMRGDSEYSSRDMKVWGNGASFDNVILRSACQATDLPIGWEFWNDMDVRTIVELGRTICGFDPKKDMPFEGVAHRALDDAKHQARYVSAIYQALQANRESITKNEDGGKDSDQKKSIFISRKTLTKLIGCRHDTIDRLVANGELPPPVKLGANGRHRFITKEIITALMKHDIDLERLAMAHGVDLNNPDA